MDIQNEIQDNTYNLNQGSMDKSFFNEYIREYVIKNCSKLLLKKCDKILEDYDFIGLLSLSCLCLRLLDCTIIIIFLLQLIRIYIYYYTV